MKIVICTPGNSFSNKWVKCFLELWMHLLKLGHQPILSQSTSCNIYYVRQMCLGADVSRGKNQKPFNGQEYDYILWIDSDMIFTPDQFDRLLAHKKDVVGGLYAFEGGTGFTCGKLDEEYYRKNGIMEYYTPVNVPLSLFEVDYIGFGFLLVKKGVYEKLEYPWHRPEWFEFGDIKDFSMEDVGWAINVKKAGFKLYCDPQTRVGHLKSKII